MIKVAVAEDNASLARVIAENIELNDGLELLFIAANGVDLLEQVQTKLPDIILMDIGMPDMDGFAVARRIKAMLNPPRIILLSMHNDAVSKKRGAEAGCDAFVGKEFGWGVLLPVLKTVLES